MLYWVIYLLSNSQMYINPVNPQDPTMWGTLIHQKKKLNSVDSYILISNCRFYNYWCAGYLIITYNCQIKHLKYQKHFLKKFFILNGISYFNFNNIRYFTKEHCRQQFNFLSLTHIFIVVDFQCSLMMTY